MIPKLQMLARSGAVRGGAFIVVAALGIAGGAAYGVEVAFLVLAGSALAAVIVALWSSVQSLTGESPLTFEEALSMGAPSAEEEQKRAVLRALKDLEYERSVGKISAEDYQEYSARYRAEAKRLIQAVDESLNSGRRQVEELLGERLAKAKAAKKAEPAALQDEHEAVDESPTEAAAESEPEPTPAKEDA